LLRIILAALWYGLAAAAAPLAAAPVAAPLATPPDQGSAGAMHETRDQILVSVLHQSIGAPARADIGDEATVRLEEDLTIVPREPASRLLAVSNLQVPTDFQALLLGSEGMDAPGLIRFVPAGFIDSDAALAWTADDFLSSLKDTVAHGNADRVKRGLEEREARGWVQPPHYDPETHQLSWAALILPKSAPRESDGEIIYHAIGFGRAGYVELTIVTSLQKADAIGHMAADFLHGLSFLPDRAYGDALPTDRRAPGGLAAAMGIDSLHKEYVDRSFWGADTVVPIAGGVVAGIGALSLLIYIQRYLRRYARRG
jgi:uncharacterized membrane-anchored protein